MQLRIEWRRCRMLVINKNIRVTIELTIASAIDDTQKDSW